MNIRHVFKKTTPIDRPESSKNQKRPEVPGGLLRKCNKCGKAIYTEESRQLLYTCPKCGGYFRMPAQERIKNIADPGTFQEWNTGIEERNPLKLREYPTKLEQLKETTGLDEAVVTGECRIEGNPAVLMVMDGRFLTGSMGYVVGEKITCGIEEATSRRLPLIIFCCSGGARMQEGMSSLMQMAKTSAALKRHSEAGLLYISVLTDPTTGGVTASFAMLGDIILAEPGALIGFAGPRVIEQTIGQKLPKGFQRSEFLLEHGFIDHIVKRQNMREMLARLLLIHSESKQEWTESIPSVSEQSRESLLAHANEKTAWERVGLSRELSRPVGKDYILALFDGFIELHGDRYFGDDPAICGGVAWFHGQPVTVIAQMKGKNTADNVKYNFGMPNPEGYRKALRLMKQAEKFHRPILCLVDTPGAYCGMEAEERGQGEAIARNLFEMSDLKTPILSLLIGEGGSGGALAMAVSDEVWIMENAIYSILSPEGFASILWKDSSLAEKAAKYMKLTSYDLYKAGFVDDIIIESGKTHRDIIEELDQKITRFLMETKEMDITTLTKQRYERFRQF